MRESCVCVCVCEENSRQALFCTARSVFSCTNRYFGKLPSVVVVVAIVSPFWSDPGTPVDGRNALPHRGCYNRGENRVFPSCENLACPAQPIGGCVLPPRSSHQRRRRWAVVKFVEEKCDYIAAVLPAHQQRKPCLGQLERHRVERDRRRLRRKNSTGAPTGCECASFSSETEGLSFLPFFILSF